MAILSKFISDSVEVADDVFPDFGMVRGIPAYAFDMHTRAGAAAIQQFCRHATELRRALQELRLPEESWFDLVRHCLFDLDSGLVRRRLVDPVSTELRRHAESIGYGRTPNNTLAVMSAIQGSWPIYAELRARIVGA